MGSKFPPNFSWVLDGELAALAYPRDPAHIQYMIDHQIKCIVSLTENVPPALKHFPDIDVCHIGIVDFTPPTVAQVDLFVNLVEKSKGKQEAVAVHCAHGRGRTGTMIACYLVKSLGYSSQKAISEIRRLRPGSIETHQQEDLVHQYALHISKQINNNI